MEYFTKIKNYEKYEISNKGRIRKSNKILKGSINSGGYLQIRLSNGLNTTKKYVHRLVLETFKGYSTLDVNHIDHNKLNNSLTNLEYVTKKENVEKRHIFYNTVGTVYKKCECGNKIWKTSNKCKKCSSKEKLEYLLNNYTYLQVSRKLGVSDTTIRKWYKEYFN